MRNMRALTAALVVSLFGTSAVAQRPAPTQTPAPPAAPSPSPPPSSDPSARPEGGAALDALFAALKSAQNEHDAAVTESHIVQLWIASVSPAARLLVARGTRELQGGANAEAVEDFNALVVLEPNLPEAYHQRALARYAAGNSSGAIEDIKRVLQLEPRHFPALGLLSRIAEARGDWQGAYQAWIKVMALDPKAPGGEARLKMLRLKAVGRET